MMNNKYTEFASVEEQNIPNDVAPVASLTRGERLALTLNSLYHI